MESKTERNKKIKSKWYGFGRLTLRVPKKGSQSSCPVANKKFQTTNPCNNNSHFMNDQSKNHRPPEAQPEVIPFRVMLNRKSSSLDDLCLNHTLQRREGEGRSVILFLRSILPDLQKMNAVQIHQFRTRSLNTIGDILFAQNKNQSSSPKISGLNQRLNSQIYNRRPTSIISPPKLSPCFSDSTATSNDSNHRKCSHPNLSTSDKKMCFHSHCMSPDSI